MPCDNGSQEIPQDDSIAFLTIDGLTFGYTVENNLDGLDLRANKGEFIGLLGPNGSGKTTLMRCINKVLKIREGTVFLDGEDMGDKTRKEMSKLCTTVPADIPTDFSLSTREFVTLGRAPYVTGMFWETDEDLEIVDRAMYDFGIAQYADRRLHELSSGERARALLAKGVVQHPKLMMVDEPSAHLDIKYKIQVMEMLKGLARSGLTVIMASHDLNLVTRYCDKVMLLHDGKIIDYGPCDKVVTEQSIREVFDISIKIVWDNGVPYIIPRPPVDDDSDLFSIEYDDFSGARPARARNMDVWTRESNLFP